MYNSLSHHIPIKIIRSIPISPPLTSIPFVSPPSPPQGPKEGRDGLATDHHRQLPHTAFRLGKVSRILGKLGRKTSEKPEKIVGKNSDFGVSFLSCETSGFCLIESNGQIFVKLLVKRNMFFFKHGFNFQLPRLVIQVQALDRLKRKEIDQFNSIR